MDDMDDLLRSAERPRELHDDELARIRAKVPGLGADAHADVIELPNLGADGPRHAANRRSGLPRRYLAVAAVAAVAIVVGIFFTGGGGDDGGVNTADNPEVLLQTPLEQVCTRDITRLASAIDAWDGVANWALTQNGEPALGDLANQALVALSAIEGLEGTATAASQELEESLADADLLGGPERRSTRVEAVTTAGTTIVELVRSHPDGAGCALDRLQEVLGR